MIFDGMGVYNLSMHLSENDFLRQHLVKPVFSVYPPTTVAATTAFYSGLQPCETGWLGWTQYFSEVDANVVMFLNKDDNNKVVADYPVANTYVPYKSIISKLKDKFVKNSSDSDSEKLCAESISPHGTVPYKGLSALFEKVEKYCREPGRHYLECYFEGPDNKMHKDGVQSKSVHECIQQINTLTREYSEKINSKKNDTLFIITADHGHIDARNEVITDYPEIMCCLKRLPSLEPRTTTFFVKEGMENKFKKEFLKKFGSDFLLLTKQEVIDKHIFGTSIKSFNKKKYTDFIGDFTAFATGTRAIVNTHEKAACLKGQHAGLTAEELTVPFIIIN